MSGDDVERVAANRKLFSHWLGIPIVQNLQMDHGVQVAHVQTPSDMNRTWEADACITGHPQVSLSLTTADCVPIFFHDPQAGAVGLAHAGWRGTVAGIAKIVVEAMVSQLQAQPERIRVGLGPGIGPCCFEVGEEVGAEFVREFGEQPWMERRATEKWHLDLHEANQIWLTRAGVEAAHIRSCPLCTCCRGDLFYSWRRDQGVTGRMLSAIGLVPNP
jgi:YfiH family protein